MKPLALLCILVVSGFGAQVLHASTPSGQDGESKLVEIRVIGSHRFQPAELAKATGLLLGKPTSDSALKEGADRLASSGMFSDVVYSFIDAPEGTKVEYKVHDTQTLLPPLFDNFVWLPPAELIGQLEQMEPLFRGQIPNAGEMYQQLGTDLTTILAKLNIHATVDVFPEVPQNGGPVQGFVYKVEGVKLPIQSIQFPGASTPMDATLQEVARTALLDKDYSMAAVRSVAELDFLPQYRMRGLLKAEFGSPAATLQNRSTGDVAVTLPVTEGLCYNLAAVRWSGNTAYPATEFAKVMKEPVGKPLNAVQLETDLGAISKIYGTRGYLEARLQPQYTFDDAAKTVTVAVDVHEGDQYHMGELQFQGLAEKPAGALLELWRLHKGDVYDTSYPGLFLMAAQQRFDFSHVSVQLKQQPNPDSKTVDVTFSFKPK